MIQLIKQNEKKYNEIKWQLIQSIYLFLYNCKNKRKLAKFLGINSSTITKYCNSYENNTITIKQAEFFAMKLKKIDNYIIWR